MRPDIPVDDFWMGMAFFVASGSKNKCRQGAVIVSSSNSILSQAFDSPPECLEKSSHFRHAEQVALDSKESFVGASIYLTHTPCTICFLNILAAKIRKIVYYPIEPLEPSMSEMAHTGYIQLTEFKGNLNWMRDYMTHLECLGIF